MALIQCPECGRTVSSNAVTCPECSYPIAPGVTPPGSPAVRDARGGAGSQPRQPVWWKTGLNVVARLLFGFVIAGVGAEEDHSGAAVIGGLFIAASAIPVWYRDKIERLKARRSSASVDRLEGRVADIERQAQDQLAQIEQMYAGRLSELEERVDFAERLLTNQREQIGPG